jgi:glycerol kinase
MLTLLTTVPIIYYERFYFTYLITAYDFYTYKEQRIKERMVVLGRYVLSLDQGTTSSRAILFDRNANIIGTAQKEFTQYYPESGWVEHDPMEILSTQMEAMHEVLKTSGVDAKDIAAVGIANQRETTVLWDKKTGLPIYNAIVWQCRRTAPIVDSLKDRGYSEYIREATGLVADAYFSGTKIKWILDHVEGAYERAERGEVLFGTVDTWLVWNLTRGRAHVTDYTNASRTMIYNINTLDWDDKLLSALQIPRNMLPEVKNSSGIYGHAEIDGSSIPIAGIAGDQQAALFGQGCFERGETKNTYGTGCFLLMNTGDEPCASKNGLLTTIAAGLDGKIRYALEGSVFVGGAVVQWLRDEMHMISSSSETGILAGQVEDTGGVYLVPAFTGLGAPYWDMNARGCIIGITRGTGREHIIRAAEESIAYQSLELVSAMERDTGIRLKCLNVDGGASRDKFLMQFQADILNMPVCRAGNGETTALGAAYLAGLATGVWQDLSDIKKLQDQKTVFTPNMAEEKRKSLLAGWQKAVGRSFGWAQD